MLAAMSRICARSGSLTALAVCLMLSGCGALMDQFNAPPSPAPSPAPPSPTPTPHPPVPTEPVKRPAPRPAPTSNPEPPLAPTSNPGELSGLSDSAVIALLGPTFGNKDQGTARVLAWKSSICTFDVIFFMNVKDGSWRVLSWDMDKGSGTQPSLSTCYQSIKESR